MSDETCSRLVAALRKARRSSIRFRWGELALHGFLTLEYSVYHDEGSVIIGLPFFKLYIKAPMIITQRSGTEDWCATYGFTSCHDGVHLNWRTHCKILWWPWNWDWRSTEILDHDFKRLWCEVKGMSCSGVTCGAWDVRQVATEKASKEYDFTYTLKNGTIQERKAKVYVERRIWRCKCLPFIKKVATSIWCEFDGEVGERTGSWKGGTTGCGEDLWAEETPKQCFRRMERERRFK